MNENNAQNCYIDPTLNIKYYQWAPKEDITAYELALCLPILLSAPAIHDISSFVEALPSGARRHFVEVE